MLNQSYIIFRSTFWTNSQNGEWRGIKGEGAGECCIQIQELHKGHSALSKGTIYVKSEDNGLVCL